MIFIKFYGREIMNHNIKLSIIIPMYNSEEYIENCIKSLLNQDIKKSNYEIIVVNDGSIDRGENIIKKYQKDNKNIRLISVKNGGVSYARNIGIDNSMGEYLFFVDSDDYIAYNSIGRVLDTAIENNLEMIFFDIKRTNSNIEYVSKYSDYCKYNNIYDGIKYFTEMNVNNGPWHFFIKNKFLIDNNIKFKEGRFCEDGMFLIKSIFKLKRVSYVNADIYRYVIRESSTTNKKTKEHLNKLIDDFMYAIIYINKYYLKAINEKYPIEFIKKLESRRNSYIFFMQIRMIKAKVGIKMAKEIIQRLTELELYKYSRMSKYEYSQYTYTFIWYVLNKKYLFYLLCKF